VDRHADDIGAAPHTRQQCQNAPRDTAEMVPAASRACTGLSWICSICLSGTASVLAACAARHRSSRWVRLDHSPYQATPTYWPWTGVTVHPLQFAALTADLR